MLTSLQAKAFRLLCVNAGRWTRLKSVSVLAYACVYMYAVMLCVLRLHSCQFGAAPAPLTVSGWLQVRQAVLALQKFHSTRLERKKRLIEENPLVSLIIGLKKIPNKTRRPYRMYETSA